MALDRPRPITAPLAHLPTWFFIIGYPVYWLELYTHGARYGVTAGWPWVLWMIVSIVSAVYNGRPKTGIFGQVKNQTGIEKLLWAAGLVLAIGILAISAVAALKPIHLTQEFDCLQYHYTLPRQHLILGSFAPIPWAADDFFLLPVDFALAPFWFATVLPNKLPQFIILLGLIGVAVRLTRSLAGTQRPWAGPLVVLLILGTHGFNIQMGTGMLDLAIAYLFLAGLDSLRTGQWFLAGVELTFFFWSKPLMPLEALFSVSVLAVLYFLSSRRGWKLIYGIALKDWSKALGLFLILSLAVAGPFVGKSVLYAGTPFFPMYPGMMREARLKENPVSWQSLNKASQVWMQDSPRAYGHGRSFTAFVKHWWLLAVPEQGVNNAFDYPLGLSYLLMIGPFLFFLWQDIARRRFSPLGVLAMLIWMMWWFSVQQSRFLYLPLFLIFMLTAARWERVSRVLLVCILLGLSFEAASSWGAHKADLGRWGMDELRDKDKQLMELNRLNLSRSFHGYMDWPTHDAAYAQFPVMVRKENLPHTILF